MSRLLTNRIKIHVEHWVLHLGGVPPADGPTLWRGIRDWGSGMSVLVAMASVLGWMPTVDAGCVANAGCLVNNGQAGGGLSNQTLAQETRAEGSRAVETQTAGTDSYDAAVKQLDARSFLERQKASDLLKTAGFEVTKAVVPLLTSSDAEVAWRAREIFLNAGMKGDDEQVQRIVMILNLLLASGRSEFAKDTMQFEMRVAEARIGKIVSQLKQLGGIELQEGMDFQNGFVGNAGIGLGGQGLVIVNGRQVIVQQNARIVVGDQIINLPPELEMPGLWDPNPPFPGIPLGQDPSAPLGDQSSDDASQDLSELSPESRALIARQQTLIKAAQYATRQVNDMPLRILQADPEQLKILRTELKENGISSESFAKFQSQRKSYMVTVGKDFPKAQVKLLGELGGINASVTLVLDRIKVDADWMQAVETLAQSGSLAYLMTQKCDLGLENYHRFNELANGPNSIRWEAQGRALLGIRDSLNGNRGLVGASVGTVSPGSGAEVGGILAGDVITQVNQVRVDSFEDLRKIVAVYGVGDQVEITLKRNGLGEPKVVTVKLVEEAL